MKVKFYLWMLVALIVGAVATVSCADEFDDTEIWESIDDLEGRVAALEAWQKSVNQQISSIQTVVDAWASGKTITDVASTTDGYTITFSDGSKITLKNGENGQKGEDGKTPVIGVKEENGVYYWTIDGEFLLNNGQKVRVTGENGKDGNAGAPGEKGEDGKPGVTPQLRINSETYNWEVSVDNGATWTEVLDANGKPVSAKGEKGENGDSFFQGVEVDDEAGIVTVTLADGTEFKLVLSADRVLYFTNPGKQLDYDMDEDGHYTGLRSTTVVCNLPEEEISAIMAQLVYPDENGDIVTRADIKKVRIEMPDEWNNQFKVFIDVQETLKAILEIRVAAMDGTEYIAARQLDTTPLIEFVEFSNGVTVDAPNTFSAEVKLNFIDGIQKVKRLAIAALPTVTVDGAYEGYDDGTNFRRVAQDSYGYFEKGVDLDPYIAIPYYVIQGEELKTESDGYLHVNEDKLIFFANMIDGEYVYQQPTTPFRAGVDYTVATFVEYTDGGFDLINTTWKVPAFEYSSDILPEFTADPAFVGNTATAKVTAEGAAKLATFVVDDDAAFDENRLAYYLNSYDNRFHAYEGEKEFSFTTTKIKTFTFVAVAIDKEGKIGKPVTRDVTYSVTYGDGPEISAVSIEQQVELNKLKVSITADDADEVRFLSWDKDTWMTKDDRGARQSDATKLETYFETFDDFKMTNTFKKVSGVWVSRYDDGITLSLPGVTTPGYTDDTTGETDERTEIPATGGGQFYIFFNALKEGVHGDIYALYGKYGEDDSYKLVNVTKLGYDAFTASESAATYVYTTAYPDELASGGGDEDVVNWFTSENSFTLYYSTAQGPYLNSLIAFGAGNTTLDKVWVIKIGDYPDKLEDYNNRAFDQSDIAWAREEAGKVINPIFKDYDGENLPESVGDKLIGTMTAPFSLVSGRYMYPATNGIPDYVSKIEQGSMYVFVGQDKTATESAGGKLLYGAVFYRTSLEGMSTGMRYTAFYEPF